MLLLLAWLIVTAITDVQGATEDAAMTSGDLFGHSVAGGADLDGDSVPDYLISAPIERLGVGVVRLYSGRAGSVLHEIAGSDGAYFFGDTVRLIRDIDGDALEDLVITETKRVHAFSGATGEALWKVDVDDWPRGCEILRDANGDGFDDVVVSIVPYDGNGAVARLLSGKDGSALTEVGDVGSGGLVASLDDANGDDRGDFALVRSGGRIDVHSGAGAELLYSVLPNPDLGTSWVGLMLGTIDVNHDSIEDWAYVLSVDTDCSAEANQLVLVSGLDGRLLETTSCPWRSLSALAMPRRGSESDIDYLVGSEWFGGSVRVVSAGDGKVLKEIHGRRLYTDLGFSMACVGDVDLDGVDDYLFGASSPNTMAAAGYAELRSGADWSLIREHSVPGVY